MSDSGVVGYMMTLAVPRLAGSRVAATELAYDVPENYRGHVAVDFSSNLSVSPSFLDQIIVELLEKRRLDYVEITGLPRSNRQMERNWLLESGRSRRVINQLRFP